MKEQCYAAGPDEYTAPCHRDPGHTGMHRAFKVGWTEPFTWDVPSEPAPEPAWHKDCTWCWRTAWHEPQEQPATADEDELGEYTLEEDRFLVLLECGHWTQTRRPADRNWPCRPCLVASRLDLDLAAAHRAAARTRDRRPAILEAWDIAILVEGWDEARGQAQPDPEPPGRASGLPAIGA